MCFFSVVLVVSIMFVVCLLLDDEISVDMCCLVGSYCVVIGDVIDVGLFSLDYLCWCVMFGEVGCVSCDEDGVWMGIMGWSDLFYIVWLVMIVCGDDGIEINGIDSLQGYVICIFYDIQDVCFIGVDEEFVGCLVMLVGFELVLIVVFVYGLEDWSVWDYVFLQWMLLVYGIGVFVYDKWGIGVLMGQYIQDFDLLVVDVVVVY